MALIQFSGLASGIDSTALIEATLEQQRLTRIIPYENQISDLNDENDALGELETLLEDLKSAASVFRTLNGGGLAKGATSSDSTVLDVAASNAAAEGTYNFSVSGLASNATFSFNDRYSSTTDTINSSINDGASAADRTVSFSVGTGGDAESIAIELTSTSTASDFVSEFNTQSEKATASLINTGTDSSPSYAIMITSNASGTEDGTVTLDSVGTEIQSAGSGAFTANQLDQATNLELSIDGIAGTISRSSNTASDIIDGLTLTAESTGSATVSISADSDSTASNIEAFVDAYNAIVAFIEENDSITRDESGDEVENVFGALASTSLDENIVSSLRSALTDAGLSGNDVNILADLGVTTERDGTLAFDRDEFDEAVSLDSSSVGSILENLGESLAATNGTIDQFIRFNGLIDESISSNESAISDLQDRVNRAEDSLAAQEESLIARFARLEGLVGTLQGQQDILLGSIGSIGG